MEIKECGGMLSYIWVNM